MPWQTKAEKREKEERKKDMKIPRPTFTNTITGAAWDGSSSLSSKLPRRLGTCCKYEQEGGNEEQKEEQKTRILS